MRLSFPLFWLVTISWLAPAAHYCRASPAFVLFPIPSAGRVRHGGTHVGPRRDAHAANALRVHDAGVLHVHVANGAHALRADDCARANRADRCVVRCCARPHGHRPTPKSASGTNLQVEVLPESSVASRYLSDEQLCISNAAAVSLRMRDLHRGLLV